ncbi:MAG: hypothetical protein GY727_07125 [Gammaproteobacteria bacterium]|nr:hypothetical protein [Gammaproteobacteria bacterium]MCP4091643.1 hypothetical protein [Gammaproteobacteria bacterium]MCP4276139.1 hypothetical protein [Gammaproteobacteria bacterium]MCP4831773.1 hypothetical protein [Gammaproteobacteria bacterium]MCP4929709.1 hypothetical protein [Gammaproteobacteria bacterium]
MRLFLATFVLGLLLTLLAAHLYPLPEAPRLPSDSIALVNGGREEAFFIRLPEDRLGRPQAAAVATFPAQSFARDGNDQILAELFHVRDAQGRVIGLASKMSGTVAVNEVRGQQNTDWMLLIPSRGGLSMSTAGLSADKERLYPANYLGLDPVKSGLILFGTDEFANLTGFFVEETEIDRIDDNGQAYGVLTLRLRMQGNAP